MWPNNKEFAFTIIDDTDNATVENVAPVYELLFELGLLTTKSVWVYPPRDHYTGGSLVEEDYYSFILDLKEKGFEICLHGVGSGSFTREEIIEGLQTYRKLIGDYPSMHINHAQSPHNIYWGYRGCSKLLQKYAKWRSPSDRFWGDDPSSKYFWGDFAKTHIKYMRSRTFKGINTLGVDPRMPYRDRDKKTSSNFWFSSSDGSDVHSFTSLILPENVDKLREENGCCIVYTHFASGFVDSFGVVNPKFEKCIRYLASQGGWFVPAGELLNYLLAKKKREYESEAYFTWLDLKRFLEKWV